jgi:hypothetical protein
VNIKGGVIMDVTFSIDMLRERLLLHVGENLIIKLPRSGLPKFIEELNKIEKELKEFYCI